MVFISTRMFLASLALLSPAVAALDVFPDKAACLEEITIPATSDLGKRRVDKALELAEEAKEMANKVGLMDPIAKSEFSDCYWSCRLTADMALNVADKFLELYSACKEAELNASPQEFAEVSRILDLGRALGLEDFETTENGFIEPAWWWCKKQCTDVPDVGPDVGGDPHFQTWDGEFFSYHGACDLVLIENALFAGGKGMSLHVRTERRASFSFVSNAALRIGNDVLEVQSNGKYTINGVPQVQFPAKLAGEYTVTKEDLTECGRQIESCSSFYIDLGGGSRIQMNTKFGVVFVSVKGSVGHFEGTYGLMGAWDNAGRVGRDGTRRLSIENPEEMAAEWQVRSTEPQLFQEARFPQHPQACLPPMVDSNSENHGRHLKGLDEERVQAACAHIAAGPQKEFCLFDVRATGDLEMGQDAFYTEH